MKKSMMIIRGMFSQSKFNAIGRACAAIQDIDKAGTFPVVQFDERHEVKILSIDDTTGEVTLTTILDSKSTE